MKIVKLRKSTVIPLVLLIYLAFMSILAYPDYKSGVNSPAYYFGVIGFTLMVIILLHFFIKKREKLRKEREDDMRNR